MADTTERIIFRIKLERMLSKYSKEDQESIKTEINDIIKLSGDEVLSFETIALIIYYHLKFKELKKD